MTREEMIQYINKFNVASFAELRTWSTKQLFDMIVAINFELSSK